MKKHIIPFLLLFVAVSMHAQIDRSKQPIPGAAPAIHLQTPQTFELENGLKVLVVKNTKLPRVRIQLLIDNPPIALNKKVGVENILAYVLGNGTTTISKQDFNEEIDFMGANISFGNNSGYASTLSKYFDRVFELFADAIINPLITEEEFQTQKNRYLEALKNNKKDVATTSRQVSLALLFGQKHPFGEFATEENVADITYSDIKQYYETFFSPENAYLVVVGDVDKAKVEALSKVFFSNWISKKVPNITYNDPQDVPFSQINFVDMPNAVQTNIVVENVVNLKMTDPDYFPVLVANNILGGDFNSFLNMNLREDKGYTYGARSSTGADKYVTRFYASASVRNAVTDSAVVEFIREIKNIRENLVSTEQLALAKAKFTGDFVRALERPETVARYALNIETQNLPQNFYEDYLKKINTVTAQDIQRVANKYFKADNLRIVVTGKGSEILENLKKVEINGKPATIFYFDVYGNPMNEPNYNIAIDPSVTVENVLEKYINAVGGQSTLEKVNSLYSIAISEMQGMQLQLETKVTKSGKSLRKVTMMGMEVQKSIFDGEKGYMIAQGQKIENSDEDNKTLKENTTPFRELNAKNVVLKGIESIGGNNAFAVAFGEKNVSYYDVVTGLKIKDEITLSQNGMEIKSEVYYSDYQVVNGVNLPHTLTVIAGPQEIEFKVNQVLINEGVSDQDFE